MIGYKSVCLAYNKPVKIKQTSYWPVNWKEKLESEGANLIKKRGFFKRDPREDVTVVT